MNTILYPKITDVFFVNASDTSRLPRLQVDDGISFGLSFFETFYISDTIPFLTEHITRLNTSLSHFNIPVHVDESLVVQLVKEHELNHVALKLQVSEKNIIASIRPITYTQEYYKRGAKLMTSPVIRSSRSELVRHKSANYGDLILSLRSAHARGFDDCLFLNESGNLTESCIANIFIIKDNRLYTPSVNEGLLPGIIRNYILMSHQVIEGTLSESDLLHCDGAFLTNSLVGVVKIASLNGINLPDNPMISDIQNQYFDYIKERHESTN